MLTESHSFLSPGGTLLQLIVLPTRIHFLRVISKQLTVQVMWKVPEWEVTFELPQQTATNIIYLTLLQLIVLSTRIHFLRVISKQLTVQVMWKVPEWEVTFELPQQTATNRIASQSVFTQWTSFRISHLILLESSSLLFKAIFSLIIMLHVKTSNVTHIFQKLPKSKVIVHQITCFL